MNHNIKQKLQNKGNYISGIRNSLNEYLQSINLVYTPCIKNYYKYCNYNFNTKDIINKTFKCMHMCIYVFAHMYRMNIEAMFIPSCIRYELSLNFTKTYV